MLRSLRPRVEGSSLAWGIGSLFLGLSLLGVLAWIGVSQARTSGWAAAPATVSIVVAPTRRGGYRLTPTYTYSAGGTDYAGSTVAFAQPWIDFYAVHSAAASSAARMTAPGQVWHNPADPGEAVLVRGLYPATLGVVSWAAGTFVFVGLLMIGEGFPRSRLAMAWIVPLACAGGCFIVAKVGFLAWQIVIGTVPPMGVNLGVWAVALASIPAAHRLAKSGRRAAPGLPTFP